MERVESFKYLGHQFSMTDNNAPAVRAQMAKARGVWARVSAVLKGENAPPKVCGIFYRAVMQSGLLYGSESWVLNPALLSQLEEFTSVQYGGWPGNTGQRGGHIWFGITRVWQT